MIPETSFGGIVVLEGCFFLLCGFIAGDCLTDLAGFFWVEIVFLRVLRIGAALEVIGDGLMSRLRSIGEVVSEVSEPLMAAYTEA